MIGCAAAVMLSALLFAGCAQGTGSLTALLTNQPDAAEVQDSVQEPVNVMKQKGIYDSEDAAVVVKKDAESGTVQFQNIMSSRRYTLNYDGATDRQQEGERPCDSCPGCAHLRSGEKE